MLGMYRVELFDPVYPEHCTNKLLQGYLSWMAYRLDLADNLLLIFDRSRYLTRIRELGKTDLTRTSSVL